MVLVGEPALKAAQRAYDKGVSYYWYKKSEPEVYRILKEAYKQESLSQDYFAMKQSQQQSVSPSKDLSKVPTSLGGTQPTGLPSIGGASFSGGSSGGGSYQGPIQKGTSESVFRTTGKTVPSGGEESPITSSGKLQPVKTNVVTGRFPTATEFPDAAEKQKLITQRGNEDFKQGEAQRRTQENLFLLGEEYNKPESTILDKINTYIESSPILSTLSNPTTKIKEKFPKTYNFLFGSEKMQQSQFFNPVLPLVVPSPSAYGNLRQLEYDFSPSVSAGVKIEGGKGGVDIVRSVKILPDKSLVASELKQPYFTTARGTSLEGGNLKVLEISNNGKKIFGSYSEVAGRTIDATGAVKIKGGGSGLKSTQNIEAQGSYGSAKITPKVSFRGDIFKTGNQLNLKTDVLGKFSRATEGSSSVKFLGAEKQIGDNFILGRGGKIQGIKRNFVTDKTTLFGGSKDFGFYKRFRLGNLGDSGSDIVSTGRGTLKMNTPKVTGALGLSQEATKTVVTKLPSTTMKNIIKPTGSFGGIVSIQKQNIKTVTTKPSQSFVNLQKTNQKSSDIFGSSQRSFLNQRSNQKQSSAQLFGQLNLLSQEEQQKSRQGSREIQLLKEGQKQRELLKTVSISKTSQKRRGGNPFPRLPLVKPPRVPPTFFGFFRSKPTKTKTRYSFGLQKFRVPRSPSLVAVGEQIYSKKKGRAEYSAIGIRPILIQQPRRNKRRKKKNVKD